MIRKLLIAGIASAGLLLSACDSAVLIDPTATGGQTPTAGEQPMEGDEQPTADAVDLIATAEAAGNFTTLLAALDAADLRSTLADPDNINTVFAPTDSAFEALGEDAVNALLQDSDQLTDTLLYHVLAGSNDAAAVISMSGSPITMLNGKEAAVTLQTDQLRINTANITSADITASNGIIHVIDAVLLPPADVEPESAPTDNIAQLVSNDPQFATLLTALTTAGLDSTLSQDGDFTVFAPTNDAFNAVDPEALNALLASPDELRDVLLYHVIEGTTIDSIAATAAAGTTLTSATGLPLAVSLDGDALKINNATVTQTDLGATNGVVHAIDAVLLPPAPPAPGTIVAVLSENPDYSALVSLVTQAGLVSALNDVDANFTVFAPNNKAIADAETALAAGYTSDPAALANLLLGHVHAATLTAADVIALDGTDLAMQSGTQPITVSEGSVSIGGATVVDPDMAAQNGVIHGIEAVLLP